jgi:hypothetical protein
VEKNNVTYEWTYEGNVVEKLPEGCEAFVYVITNTVSGMLYVGKKLACAGCGRYMSYVKALHRREAPLPRCKTVLLTCRP